MVGKNVKKAQLIRGPSSDQGTFGRLSFGAFVVHTTELPWRDNRQQRSCIPTGTYTVKLVNSPRFGRVYGVTNVPGRANVLIHSANVAGDVEQGWTSQLHGCIAPAERLGFMRMSDGRMQKAGLVSKPALRRLMDWADGEPFTLEIE